MTKLLGSSPVPVLAFLFLPYTLLLLLGQWLQTKSHLFILSWVRNPKLKAILDTYHAPYKPKHWYWTGLLLSVHCALFLVFAFNISGNDSVNLLVIFPTTFGIFILFALFGMVYKSWCLNVLELSFIFNLGTLVAATIHVNFLVEARLLLHTPQLALHSSSLWGFSPTTFTCESNQKCKPNCVIMKMESAMKNIIQAI